MIKHVTRNRANDVTAYPGQPLFAKILLPFAGNDMNWLAFDQALQVARREDGRLEGLYVVPSLTQVSGHTPRTIRDQFDRRCQHAGVSGGLLIEVGDVCRKICEQARWTDLIVLDASHCFNGQPSAWLNSKLDKQLRSCSKPVLAVPGGAGSPKWRRAILAYDGSHKAYEALSVAHYLATSSRWRLSLTMVTVLEGHRVTSEQAKQAQAYLESSGVEVQVMTTTGAPAEAILNAAAEERSDVVVMGGHGLGSLLQIVHGSTIDQILRQSSNPVLICRSSS